MNSFSKLKQISLILGDIAILYLTLILTLWLRYDNLFYSKLINTHIEPFTIIFGIWLIVFYIAGLYDLQALKNNFEFEKKFWYALGINLVIAALFFYSLPFWGITPRANLGIFFLIFGGINYLWRQTYNALLSKTEAANRALLIGSNKTAEEIAGYLE